MSNVSLSDFLPQYPEFNNEVREILGKEFVNDHLHSQKMKDLSFLNSKQIQNDVNKFYKNNQWNINNASEAWSIVNALLINE
jgi:hypothetical protein